MKGLFDVSQLTNIVTHTDVKNAFSSLEQPGRALLAARFFKTKPGQYGEGDQFWGLSMPRTTLRYAIERFEPGHRRYYLNL